MDRKGKSRTHGFVGRRYHSGDDQGRLEENDPKDVRVMERSDKREGPFSAPHCLPQTTLGSLVGASGQSLGLVIWP